MRAWIALASAALGLAALQAPSGAPPALPEEPGTARIFLEAEGTKTLPPALTDLAAAPDTGLRARVALALGRIGLPDGAAALVALAGDADASVRAAAVFALGKLELDLQPAVPPDPGVAARVRAALEDAVADPQPAVSGAALWSLGFVDGGGDAVGEWLRSADPGSVDERAAELALLSWWRIGGDAAVVEPFADAVSGRVRLAAAHTLRRLDVPAGLPLLARLLDDADPEVRLMAIRGLGQAPLRVVSSRAVELMEDRDWRVQCEAARWLGSAWTRDPETAPEERAFTGVLRRSLDRNLHVRRCALEALGAVVGRRAVAADRLLEAVDAEEPAVRATALAVLAGGEASIRERAWNRVLGDEPRPAANVWLARLEAHPVLVAPLLQLQSHADPAAAEILAAAARGAPSHVAEPALRLLARMAPERAAALAQELLASDDPAAVSRGASTLADLVAAGELQPDPQRTDVLWRRFYDSRGSALEPARGALLGALLEVDPELMARRSVLLLREPDRTLRLRAFRALRVLPALTEALARVDEPFRGHGPAADVDWSAMATQALRLQAAPVRVGLSSPRGEAVLELRADWAPRTVVQLVELLRSGAFETTRFHRVIPGFVAQGAPAADGAPVSLPGEDSLIRYDAGTVGLALAGRDTGTDQIYVTHAAQPHLEGLYPVLGRVLEGQRAIDRIQPGDLVALRLLEAPDPPGTQ